MVRSFLILLPLLSIIFSPCDRKPEKAQSKKVIIGYVPGFRGVLDVNSIDATKLTHINYAFVNVKDSLAWLTNLETDSINFRKLNTLKKINPDLKLLISLGGWSWSENFSDAVLTESSRKKFARSCVDIVDRFHLDGVDIDWEYPGIPGEEGNIYRVEDKENFTLMFKAIREELDKLSEIKGEKYQLTTAVPDFQQFMDANEMGKVQQYLDYVNLMTYDFYTAGNIAGHHSNLFPSESYEKERSVQKAFNLYTKAGVPAEKLVLGIPFYGRSWIMKSEDNHGINRPVDSVMRGGGYTFIKDSLVNKKGFTRYWDENAKMPYLFNAENNQLVTYDDEESVKHKCGYVIDHHMAGVMFWQYASDPKEYLLDAINEHLR
jgi:chitinase